MKTRTLQLTGIAAIAIAAAILASPWVLATATTTTSPGTSNSSTSSTSPSTNNQITCQIRRGTGPGTQYWFGGHDHSFDLLNPINLTVGQTITLTSSQGAYHIVGSPSDNGTASGTMTFTVTSKLSAGYTLSITSGNLVVGGTTYTISSGTAQTGPFADAITGQGTTTPTGTFLLKAFAGGSFAGTSGQLLLDLKAGSTEYAVALAGSVES